MGIISLEGMEFFAYHGHYDEEQKIGNKYGVDVHIYTDLLAAADSDSLQRTVNYEVVYKIVREEMQQPSRLLEHIAHRIISHLFREFPHVYTVKANIYKFNPPLGGICHRAMVALEEHR